MSKINENFSQVKYFLPHHAVVNKSSAKTKLGLVFDASCKIKMGLLLNNILSVGPVYKTI